MKTIPCVVSLCLFSFLSLYADTKFTVSAPIPLAGTGGFDYLGFDDAHHRLLANHTKNNSFDIVDATTDTLIKSLPLGKVQGAAYDSKHDRYDVTCSEGQKVVVIDAENFATVTEIPLTGPADGIFYNAANGFIYVGHDDAPELWIIDTATNKIVASSVIGAGPEGIAADATGQTIYQNSKSTNSLQVINAATGKVTQTYSTSPADKPHGLIVDTKNGHLIVIGSGQLVVLDAATGKVVSTLAVPTGIDQPTFDARTGLIYAPSKLGSMTVLTTTATGVTLLETLTTYPGAKTCTLDPTTHTVWTAYADAAQKPFLCKITPKL